jgi:hypothetical protein
MIELGLDGESIGCLNHGCVNRFDPMIEGWNGECDPCAAVLADHLDGVHAADSSDCRLCLTEVPAGWADTFAAAA